ncbi:MAG: hypothetical protein ACK40G_06665 [Cytophagaceae bacterium]
MNLLILFLRRVKYLLAITALISACGKPPLITSPKPHISPDTTIGVKGKVIFKEGNFNSKGEIKDNGRMVLVQRELLIYPRISQKEVDFAEGNFIKNIYAEPLDCIMSNDQGEFKIPLVPGKYTFVVKENERLFAKLSSDGFVFPVTVGIGQLVEVVVEIDYMAQYH